MTPKEKAQELVEKFLPQVRGADRYNYNLEDMNLFIAKQCALIAVDEILILITAIDGTEHWQNYYEKVKTEITNL